MKHAGIWSIVIWLWIPAYLSLMVPSPLAFGSRQKIFQTATTRAILLYNGIARELDISTGKSNAIFAATDCGFDPIGRQLLFVQNREGGSSLDIRAADGLTITSALELSGQHVAEVDWNGIKGQFILQVTPSVLKAGDASPLKLLYVDKSALRLRPFEAAKGVGLGYGSYVCKFSASPGTFAITANYADPTTIFRGINIIRVNVVGQANSARNYFVIYKDYKPWRCYTTPQLFIGYPVAFSKIKPKLIAAIPDPDGSHFATVDLSSGDEHNVDWLSYELTFVPYFRGDFDEALVLESRLEPNGEGHDPVMSVVDGLFKQGDDQAKRLGSTTKPQALLACFAEHKEPKLVLTFGAYPNLAITGEANYFLVSDGAKLWRIADGEVQDEKQLQ